MHFILRVFASSGSLIKIMNLNIMFLRVSTLLLAFYNNVIVTLTVFSTTDGFIVFDRENRVNERSIE